MSKPETIRRWVARDGDGQTCFHLYEPYWNGYHKIFVSDTYISLKKTHGLKPGQRKRATMTIQIEGKK